MTMEGPHPRMYVDNVVARRCGSIREHLSVSTKKTKKGGEKKEKNSAYTVNKDRDTRMVNDD